jgi:hypothetical protein
MAETTVAMQPKEGGRPGTPAGIPPRVSDKPQKAFVISFSKGGLDIEREGIQAVADGRLKLPDLGRMVKEGILRREGGRTIINVRYGSNSSESISWNNISAAIKQSNDSAASNMLLCFNTLLTHPLSLQRANAERLSVIEQLNELGYMVFVPDYGLPNLESVLGRARLHARVFNARFPPAIGRLGDLQRTKEIPSSIFWTRDLWYRFNGSRIMRYGRNGENAIGEGGMLVPINQKSTLVSETIHKSPGVLALSAKGHRFYTLKDGIQFLPKLSSIYRAEVYKTMDHVDLFVGVVGDVMLVEPSYFTGLNKTVLKQAARDNGLKIVFVQEDESKLLAANFLILGDRKVLMNKSARKTAELLRQNGIDVVATRVELKANALAEGGVRCFANEL